MAEGLADDMEEYVQRLRALKWQVRQAYGCIRCTFRYVHPPTRPQMHLQLDTTHRQRRPIACTPTAERLRCLQAMAVRGQEDVETSNELAALDAARRFGSDSNLQELAETGMSELAAACRAAGLENLFLAALKIVK